MISTVLFRSEINGSFLLPQEKGEQQQEQRAPQLQARLRAQIPRREPVPAQGEYCEVFFAIHNITDKVL